MTAIYIFMWQWLIPILVSSLTFFVGRIFSERDYEKKLNDIQATLQRMDERQANFMGYFEEYKVQDRAHEAKQDEKQAQYDKDLNRFYSEYLPYLQFKNERK